MKTSKTQIHEFLHKWQHILCLEDWQLCLDWSKEPANPNPDAGMRVYWPRHYRSADITIFPTTLTRSPLLVDQSICHELLHLVFAPADDELADLVGEESEVFRRFKQHMEGCIDHLAVALGKSAEKVD